MPDGKGRVRLDYMIPSRGLIGFQTDFRTMTSGTGLMHHIFDHFGPVLDREIGQRQNGVLISNGAGQGAGLRAVQPAGARPADASATAMRSTKARSSASTAATTTWS